VTCFRNSTYDREKMMEIGGICDPRKYHVVNIHEDLPGIDHIGIVNKISKLFLEINIPILYINTYSYNLILISDEHFEKAMELISKIL